MRSVDAYLSRRAARIWPGALVTCDADTRTDWQLQRPDVETVELGHGFADARRSVDAMRDADIYGAIDRIRDRVAQERRATERLLRVVSGESDDGYARASDAWHAARRMTDEALGVEEAGEHRASA